MDNMLNIRDVSLRSIANYYDIGILSNLVCRIKREAANGSFLAKLVVDLLF